MSIKAIITGASGMVGEGVLFECLESADVAQVLVVGRKPCGVTHAKLREVLHADFHDLAPIADQLRGYDACFFCLGVSSVGMSQADYERATRDLTLGFAQVLAQHNPELTFCYVTGRSTDSSESGPVHWARVKGATENALLKMLPRAVMFRPAFMLASPGQKNLKRWYRWFEWMYLMRPMFPKAFCTLSEVGRAMIVAARKGSAKRVLEVLDIVELSKG